MVAETGPIVTTIIPTYRRPQKLRRAILSALRQTYVNLRVCVYDNASSDETSAVVREIAASDARVSYFCHPETIDAGDNFQFGLSCVTTEFFSFLGDDDVLLPACYENALVKLHKFPEALCCVGSAVDIQEDGGQIIDIPLQHWPDLELFTPPEGLFAILKHYANWCGTVFRKEVIDQIGPLDCALKTFDFEYLVRLASRFQFAISKELSALFVHHKQSYSGKRLPKLYWPSWKIIFENIQNEATLAENEKSAALILLEKKLHKHLFSAAVSHLKSGNLDIAQAAAEILEERFPHHALINHMLYRSIHFSKKFRLVQLLLSRLIHIGETIRRKVISSKFKKHDPISIFQMKLKN